jgi:hypothetical protein
MQGHGRRQAPEPQPAPQLAALAGSGITLRPATPADAGFCYRLHKAAMGETEAACRGGQAAKVTMRSARHRK